MKPEVSLPFGAAVAVLVFSIYQQATPAYVDLRVSPPNDPDVASARKMATWTAAAAVSAISLLAKDPVIFMIGGAAVVVMDLWNRHGNLVDPLTGVAIPRGTPNPDAAGLPADLAYTPA